MVFTPYLHLTTDPSKNVWQCDLSDGYRIAYTVLDNPEKTVIILFAGDHDDAAAFLWRSK